MSWRKQLKVQEVKSTEQLFQMLELKRISTMAVQDTMAQQYIAIHNLSNVKQVEPAITTKDYYLVFSHQFMEANAELAERYGKRLNKSEMTSTQSRKINILNESVSHKVAVQCLIVP